MTYQEFLDKYYFEIESKDFGNPVFREFYETDIWKRFLLDLEKLDINPLIGMKEIPEYFFYRSKIVKIKIPNSITSIGYCAFNNCSNLTKIIIPNSVNSLEGLAFYASGLVDVMIGNGIIRIGDRAFSGCNLTRLIYRGTRNQFKLIKKGYSWKPYHSIEVHCTDGILIYK